MIKKEFIALVLSCSLTVLISLFSMGGCDIDFSSDNVESAGPSTLKGTIISVTPERSLDGILVQITDEESGIIFSDTTDVGGTFSIEGEFKGVGLRLEFLDEVQEQLALTSVTVFPGATEDLGNLSLTNGSVDLMEDTTVTYKGDITQNNCSNNNGTLVVTKENFDVIVDVGLGTVVRAKGDDVDCSALLIGDEAEVRGVLTAGGGIDAFSVEVN